MLISFFFLMYILSYAMVIVWFVCLFVCLKDCMRIMRFEYEKGVNTHCCKRIPYENSMLKEILMNTQ